ncbi:tyrosine-type recombinase/integrase [Wolbachia endosymbiont of Pentalonia nigronervosa]|uniref:tyrosine-type recombinase/integrase n=1 Tax=Wolbachia endosymbiont of Pentalonia nigronervosa TaxID=1301914 RepID=UPI00165FD43A|nr:tyrosine-type recombinase/integrase [Wolbachia endosymbiont of Pentalonia nigronervosa]MBD0391465.1 tyrosine-type recombinase/integrase [Wolbachia endosymbiont of Pentalonia nigronervosa]
MKNKQSKDKKENFYITYFLDALVSEKSSTQNTLESYRSDLCQLDEFLSESNTTLLSADKATLKEYLDFLCKQKNYKGSSVSRKISAIKNFYKCLFNDGVIDSNPVPANDDEFKNQKSSRPLPKYLSVEEIILMINTVRKLSNGSNKEISNKRLCAVLEILYSSGMRISELINIKLHEVLKLVSNSNKECYIIIKGKNGRERQILFSEQAIQSLKSYLSIRENLIPKDKHSDWLFPGEKHNRPITRQRIGQLMKSLARKCGIDETKVSPHVIRHSFATHLLNSGANIVLIQKVLGHTNLSTTQIYTHVANEKLKNKLTDSHPIARMANN